jgi:HPt (histidine-containing phosphotransfer) domain-containing protein
VDTLRKRLDAGDAGGAGARAHTIQGAAANVGGERLRAVAFEMEEAARAGDLAALGALLPALEAQFPPLRDALLAQGSAPAPLSEARP